MWARNTRAFYTCYSFTLLRILHDDSCHPQFTDEKTEIERYCGAGLGSEPSKWQSWEGTRGFSRRMRLTSTQHSAALKGSRDVWRREQLQKAPLYLQSPSHTGAGFAPSRCKLQCGGRGESSERHHRTTGWVTPRLPAAFVQKQQSSWFHILVASYVQGPSLHRINSCRLGLCA